MPRWKPMFPGARCDAELVVTACSVTVASKKTSAVVELNPAMDNVFRVGSLFHGWCWTAASRALAELMHLEKIC